MPPRLDCIIFCDDIRHEAGSKLTLVGIYGTTLLTSPDTKFPAALPKLCIFLRWRGIEGGEKLYFDLYYNGEELVKPGVPSELKSPKDVGEYSQTSLFLMPMILKGFGEYKFRIFLEHHAEPLGEAILRVRPQSRDHPLDIDL